MLESLQSALSSYGLFGLFLASFLASTIVPFGSEWLVLLLIQKQFDILVVVVVASVGNFMGACTSYYIGFKGRGLVERHLGIEHVKIERAERYFLKYGSYVLLFTWLPFIGDVFTVVSGLLRLKFWLFSVLVFTGKFLRYLAVAYLAGAIF